MATPRPSRRRASVAVIAVRLAAYLLVAWGTLVALTSGLFPGAAAVTIPLAIYKTVPLLAFIRWRGWPFYPGRGFRLFVVRPFWYTQLLLPLVAAAGLIGLILGAPFGVAFAVGRTLAGAMLAFAAGVLLLGYLGSGRLTVRRVDTEVPGLGPEF